MTELEEKTHQRTQIKITASRPPPFLHNLSGTADLNLAAAESYCVCVCHYLRLSAFCSCLFVILVGTVVCVCVSDWLPGGSRYNGAIIY